MTRGSTHEYKFGQKNNWRRWQWNDVLRRTAGREKYEPILYLAGPNDLDRAVAISKGVPSLNLIAIDKKRTTIQSIRDEGNTAICGDVIDVLTTWPKTTPVCAIVLDFCRGFQKIDDLKRLANLTVAHPPLKKAVVAINMQRGKDAESNDLRAMIGQFISRQMPGVDPKHRGMIFAVWYALFNITRCAALVDGFKGTAQWTPEQTVAAWQCLFQQFEPKMFTYRSGGLFLDSVVMTSAGELFDVDPLCTDWVKEEVYRSGVRSVALSTSATLAVRTRRLRT